MDVFEKFERSSRDIKEVFINSNFSALNPNTGRVKHLFKEFIIKNNLQNFQNDFDIKTQADFLRCIQYIQNIGFLLIACFSGMRKAEVLSLPQNCLNINKIKSNNLGVNALENKLVYSLHGYTSKTSTDGIRTATWITCKEVEKVIHSLNDIVIIAKAYNDQNGLYKGIEIEKYPLFCHLCFARKFEIEAMFSIYEYPVALLNGLKLSVDRLVKNTELNEDDLAELYRFNPLIDWLHTYNLEIGKKWGFRPHQFRRSLVVYGVRSGMIQLSVLKKQLQHLNIDMTTYYGNDTSSAIDIFEEHLVESFRAEDIRYQFAQYEEKVLDNTDVLYGGEGTRLYLAKKSEDRPKYLESKETTLQYFDEGRLSYKKTPLGGCARKGSCNKLGFSYITACIECKDSIFDSSSTEALLKVKNIYEGNLSKYDSDSITHKQITIEINSIDKILNKIKVLEINNV